MSLFEIICILLVAGIITLAFRYRNENEAEQAARAYYLQRLDDQYDRF